MEYSERISIRDFVLDYIAHCEYTCDLTLWYERIAQETAA